MGKVHVVAVTGYQAASGTDDQDLAVHTGAGRVHGRLGRKVIPVRGQCQSAGAHGKADLRFNSSKSRSWSPVGQTITHLRACLNSSLHFIVSVFSSYILLCIVVRSLCILIIVLSKQGSLCIDAIAANLTNETLGR